MTLEHQQSAMQVPAALKQHSLMSRNKLPDSLGMHAWEWCVSLAR